MKNRFFNHAKTIAQSSDFKTRHGAVLVRGGSIIKSSCNKGRPVGFAHRYHRHNRSSLHAEIGVVLNLKKNVTYGCDIFVVRIDKNDKLANSKPCDMCQEICSEMGINRIYYSDTNGFNFIKL